MSTAWAKTAAYSVILGSTLVALDFFPEHRGRLLYAAHREPQKASCPTDTVLRICPSHLEFPRASFFPTELSSALPHFASCHP